MRVLKGILTVLTLVVLVSSQVSFGGIVQDRIATERFYLNRYDLVFSKSADVFRLAEAIKKLSKSEQLKVTSFIKSLEPLIPSNLLAPLSYYTFIKPSQEGRQSVFEMLLLNRLLVVRDALDDPRSSVELKSKAEAILLSLTKQSKTDSLWSIAESEIISDAQALSRQSKSADSKVLVEALAKNKFTNFNIKTALPGANPFCLVLQGFVAGNQVEVLSQNDRSKERMDWINANAIIEGGKIDFTLPFMTVKTHPVLQDPIFKRIWEMMDRAQESIFIDIFLFGGTMGATLSKHLFEMTQMKRILNPNFRVLILHDFATNYNMIEEMMPVFEYIRDSILAIENSGGDSGVTLLQSNIQRHPPGIPFGITNLIPQTDETFKAMEKKNTYYESKIDHSKVIVIDANTPNAEANFGSKNWTDHSGAYYYDDTIWIKGPSAALVQASYYDDVDAALSLDKKEQAWFYFKEKGFANDRSIKKRQAILDWMKVTHDSYPSQGSESVRMAEANVDGKIKDVRNLIIEMISKAQHHIYTEQLFLYDKYIVDALIKRKIQMPKLDIKILVDSNGNFGMNGFPNTMFMGQLMAQGIQIKFRTTLGVKAKFLNGNEREFHQENHRKIMSVDSNILVGGSSNMNPDTLQGSFREFGAQIFSKIEIEKFESSFLDHWANDQKTSPIDIRQLKLKFGKSELDAAKSAVLNAAGRAIVTMKDKLEGKNPR